MLVWQAQDSLAPAWHQEYTTYGFPWCLATRQSGATRNRTSLATSRLGVETYHYLQTETFSFSTD